MYPYDDYIQLNNESKVQSERFAPLTSLMSQLLALPKSGVQKPILIPNQDCSIHCNNVHGFISYHIFGGRKHIISDETSIIFLLFSLFSSSNFPVRSLKKYAQLLLLRGDKV